MASEIYFIIGLMLIFLFYLGFRTKEINVIEGTWDFHDIKNLKPSEGEMVEILFIRNQIICVKFLEDGWESEHGIHSLEDFPFWRHNTKYYEAEA